jgi:hypothetical protein
MRTLLVAAAAIISFTAAQAQEMVPAKTDTPPTVQESNDRAMPVATPSSALIDQLKAAGELKDTKDPKALEAPAPRLEPVQAEAKPVEEKKIEVLPAQVKPAETPVIAKPTETKPAATPPVAAAPAATTPAATTPAATTTTAAKPAETKPVQAASENKPAKKKVVRKQETDEQKARRIAAKYGISW